MKAALIATGNEIVSGQILNTNTSWLASQLSKEGLDTHFHMAVLDNKEDLVETLSWLKNKDVDHVFISGGLGPTRDDLTREIVAEFCNKKFDFYEPRWLELKAKLEDYGIEPREGHKWQCYFPSGSSHLINKVGTAWGFSTETEDKKMKIWALPGPPKELENTFKNSICPWLKENIKSKMELLTWQCLNTPESEVAHMTELALEGCNYEIGYRASPPITEVKLWVPIAEVKDNIWSKKLDELFKTILYSKNGTDYLKILLDLYDDGPITVSDSVTNGELLIEIREKYPKIFKNLKYNFNSNPICEGAYLSIHYGLTSEKSASMSLSTNLNENKVFSEEFNLEKVKNLGRAKKLVLAKLIKKAVIHLSPDSSY